MLFVAIDSLVGLSSALSFCCCIVVLGLQPLQPFGLPVIFFVEAGREGSMWHVSLAHVRPVQISRTVFSLIPKYIAVWTADGHGCMDVFAVSLIWKIWRTCLSLRIALGLTGNILRDFSVSRLLIMQLVETNYRNHFFSVARSQRFELMKVNNSRSEGARSAGENSFTGFPKQYRTEFQRGVFNYEMKYIRTLSIRKMLYATY
jgi:hypothetical protein